VFQARDWDHGVLVGAAMASETTAAATGDVGVVRRDPMAMKPFAGYNFGDYWRHWFKIGERVPRLPGIFQVNWFRRDAAGKFLWPGYGENLRVLAWIIDRCKGTAEGVETAIGTVPQTGAIDLTGLHLPASTMQELLAVDCAAWRQEIAAVEKYFEEFGTQLPEQLRREIRSLETRLG
jgi:phosphoenolpyruvate carboxykinase (GTP)